MVPSDPETFIPTGGLCPVPKEMEFNGESPLEVKLSALPPPPPAFGWPRGVNTTFVVEGVKKEGLGKGLMRNAAKLTHIPTGRTLTVRTTQPCIHLYTAFAFKEDDGCVDGVPLTPTSVIALECQLPADTANRAFDYIPRGILRPGEKYSEIIEYALSW